MTTSTPGASNLLSKWDRILVLVMLSITPWITGCAQIKSFTVAPSTICPGESVEITWKASDAVSLRASPPLAGEGEGPAEGARSLAPERSTRFTLKAKGLLKSDQREWDVQVIPSQAERFLGGLGRCEDDRFVTTAFTIEQEATSPHVHAVSIVNQYKRPLMVSKDGIEVEIPANSATERFNAVPVAGVWTIRARVGPDETCGDALDAVSGRLSIRTRMSCMESSHGNP